MATLFIQFESHSQTVEISEDKVLYIGRSEECDICLPYPAISRRHAVIAAKNSLFGIKDLGSANSTFLNGQKVDQPKQLRDGDIVRIGGCVLRFSSGASNTTSIKRRPPPASASPAASAESESPRERPDRSTTTLRVSRAMMAMLGDAPPPSTRNSTDTVRLEKDGPKADASNGKRNNAQDAFDTAPYPPQDREPVAPMRVDPSANPTIVPPADFSDISDLADPSGRNGKSKNGLTSLPDAPTLPVTSSGSAAVSGADSSPEKSASSTGAILSDTSGLALTPELRRLIETRLQLYSLLDELTEERRLFLLQNATPSKLAASELERQNRECQNPPLNEEVDSRLEEASLDQGKPVGTRAMTEEMRALNAIALRQWTTLAQSNRNDLPPLYDLSYRLMADEPLAEALAREEIEHRTFLGGAAYSLFLEKMLAETDEERNMFRKSLLDLQEERRKKNSGTAQITRFFGKLVNSREKPNPEAEREAGLQAEIQAKTDRMAVINRELAFMEKTLNQEFWRIYTETAATFLSRDNPPPPEVRAFIRYGVIGLKPWWLRAKARERILRECSAAESDRVKNGTAILYADEYLLAVRRLECTPIISEDMTRLDKASAAWKTDRALRRSISGKIFQRLLRERLEGLERQADEYQQAIPEMERKLAAAQVVGNISITGRRIAMELEKELHERQQKNENAQNLVKRVREEFIKVADAAVAESDRRFASGELTIPPPETLIFQECMNLKEICDAMAGARPRFIPFVLRDHFSVGSSMVNERDAVRSDLEKLERLDPGIFTSPLDSATKRSNRFVVRACPEIVLLPAAGVSGCTCMGRDGMENGRLAIPIMFLRENSREQCLADLFAEYRWESARKESGRDLMTSDTLAGAFMRLRWEWRDFSKQKRDKGLIISEMSDLENWRRLYAFYLSDATSGGKKLFERNFDCYATVICPYIDPPDGVEFLKKSIVR